MQMFLRPLFASLPLLASASLTLCFVFIFSWSRSSSSSSWSLWISPKSLSIMIYHITIIIPSKPTQLQLSAESSVLDQSKSKHRYDYQFHLLMIYHQPLCWINQRASCYCFQLLRSRPGDFSAIILLFLKSRSSLTISGVLFNMNVQFQLEPQ